MDLKNCELMSTNRRGGGIGDDVLEVASATSVAHVCHECVLCVITRPFVMKSLVALMAGAWLVVPVTH